MMFLNLDMMIYIVVNKRPAHFALVRPAKLLGQDPQYNMVRMMIHMLARSASQYQSPSWHGSSYLTLRHGFVLIQVLILDSSQITEVRAMLITILCTNWVVWVCESFVVAMKCRVTT
ncbi:Uncharacterized protein HZ326_20308 [Fusarium oxysporum f. sp. albedinis]|nr:Uncharacterized protein HZ326_20308 [Fusarium oxysporum f. sp. albedinis]